ncbi:MAG: hypothetical protein ACHQ50_07085 [Fimbriimonadales bacterium]
MLGLLGFGFGALVLSAGHAGAQGGGHADNVRVVNTPTVNVAPDQSINVGNSPTVHLAPDATVHVSGDSTVHIASDSTVQVSGTPTVQIAPDQGINVNNSPTVHIAPDATVHIASDQKLHIADNNGQFLWDPLIQFVPGSDEADLAFADQYVVPAGKRLVIEGISYATAETSLGRVTLGVGGPFLTLGNAYYLPVSAPINGEINSGTQMTIRLEAGQRVVVFANRVNTSSGSEMEFSIAGRLEDAP